MFDDAASDLLYPNERFTASARNSINGIQHAITTNSCLLRLKLRCRGVIRTIWCCASTHVCTAGRRLKSARNQQQGNNLPWTLPSVSVSFTSHHRWQTRSRLVTDLFPFRGCDMVLGQRRRAWVLTRKEAESRDNGIAPPFRGTHTRCCYSLVCSTPSCSAPSSWRHASW